MPWLRLCQSDFMGMFFLLNNNNDVYVCWSGVCLVCSVDDAHSAFVDNICGHNPLHGLSAHLLPVQNYKCVTSTFLQGGEKR